MPIDAISQTTNPSTATVAGTGLSGDLNTFLKLFTVQLQNQDPTNPLDTNEMTSQLAQFSTVEQQARTNQGIEKLIAAQQQTQLSTAVSYLNREVETEGNTGTLSAGQATFSYFLPESAQSAQVTITNAAGRAVFNGQGSLDKGRNLVVWDGTNSFNGDDEPNGKYTITVKAKNAAGNDMDVDTRAVGIVTGVESSKEGKILLSVGDVEVPFDEILAVRDPVIVDLGTGNAS
ncbi:MAG: flagellar hook assembly protein FlgD [Alphaproteobacteria bacterium]|nr:flagellar hook assembly protein FlgD [Alphaproteobacteria bacterium]